MNKSVVNLHSQQRIFSIAWKPGKETQTEKRLIVIYQNMWAYAIIFEEHAYNELWAVKDR